MATAHQKNPSIDPYGQPDPLSRKDRRRRVREPAERDERETVMVRWPTATAP
ncbi:hypothetical protein [Streptomyces sp. NPDC093991]|uniref:hypothetical protein n=1 Tax=unclassified Streptomyces TaxID=2593676 RepID=UPI0034498644